MDKKIIGVIFLVLIISSTVHVPLSQTQSNTDDPQSIAKQVLQYIISEAETDGDKVKWLAYSIDGVDTYDAADLAWGQLGPATTLLEAYHQTNNLTYLDYTIRSALFIADLNRSDGGGLYWYHSSHASVLSPDVARVGDFFLKIYLETQNHPNYSQYSSKFLECTLGAARWLAKTGGKYEYNGSNPDDYYGIYFKYSPLAGAHGIQPGREIMTASLFLHLHQAFDNQHTFESENGSIGTPLYYINHTTRWLLEGPDLINESGVTHWQHNRPYNTYNPPPLDSNGWIVHYLLDLYDEFGEEVYLNTAKSTLKYLLARQTTESDEGYWVDLLTSAGATANYSVPFNDFYFRVDPKANNLLLRALEYNNNSDYLEACVKHANWLNSISIPEGNGRKIPYYLGDTTYKPKENAAIYNYLINLCNYDLSQIPDADLTRYKELASDILTWLEETAAPGDNGGIKWSGSSMHGEYMWMGSAGTAYHLVTSITRAHIVDFSLHTKEVLSPLHATESSETFAVIKIALSNVTDLKYFTWEFDVNKTLVEYWGVRLSENVYYSSSGWRRSNNYATLYNSYTGNGTLLKLYFKPKTTGSCRFSLYNITLWDSDRNLIDNGALSCTVNITEPEEYDSVDTASISLYPGWNLIACPFNTKTSIDQFCSMYNMTIDYIYEYDTQTSEYSYWIRDLNNQFQSLQGMEPGKGYWVHIT